jgi:tRNA(adenine34) deaminase
LCDWISANFHAEFSAHQQPRSQRFALKETFTKSLTGRNPQSMQSSLLAPLAIVKQAQRAILTPLGRVEFLSADSFCLACYAHAKMDTDLAFMRQALDEARVAAAQGEVPVGAVLVRDGQVVARAANRTLRDCDPTAHAEILVLREAARIIGNHRLADTILYVTIEPCSMCAGAMIQARIPRLVYGGDDPKGGAVRSCFEILTDPRLNHRVQVSSGVLAAECSATIQSFFVQRR